MPITSTKRAYSAGKVCATCGATFTSKKKLAAHIKKAHPKKPGMMKTI